MKSTMLAFALVISSSIAFAAPGAARSPRETLANYTKLAREAIYGKAGSAGKLNETALNEAKNIIIKELNIPKNQQRVVLSSLSGEHAALRMDNLITVIAAKKMSAEIAKVDAPEARSIESAADATARFITNTTLVGAKDASIRSLSKEELTLVKESLGKIEQFSSEMIINFSRGERDSYTQVLNKLSDMAQTGRKSYEESFVDAIMEVRKVDRAKALEVVKKLKECV